MVKFFTSRATHKYIDVLPKLVDSYNHSYHRSIKTSPIEVTDKNKNFIFENIYGVENERKYLLSKKSNLNYKLEI